VTLYPASAWLTWNPASDSNSVAGTASPSTL
jgi:hypothetical protein